MAPHGLPPFPSHIHTLLFLFLSGFNFVNCLKFYDVKKNMMYIHERDIWTQFRWDNSQVSLLLEQVRSSIARKLGIDLLFVAKLVKMSLIFLFHWAMWQGCVIFVEKHIKDIWTSNWNLKIFATPTAPLSFSKPLFGRRLSSGWGCNLALSNFR